MWGEQESPKGLGRRWLVRTGYGVELWKVKEWKKKKPRHVSVYPGWWVTMFNMNSKGKL